MPVPSHPRTSRKHATCVGGFCHPGSSGASCQDRRSLDAVGPDTHAIRLVSSVNPLNYSRITKKIRTLYTEGCCSCRFCCSRSRLCAWHKWAWIPQQPVSCWMDAGPRVCVTQRHAWVSMIQYLEVRGYHSIVYRCARSVTRGCALFFTGQGEYDIENWRMIYWRPQKGQLANPKFAAFCDSWEATKSKYPYLQEQALGVKDSLASSCSYKVTNDWSQEQPYARVCIPVRTP